MIYEAYFEGYDRVAALRGSRGALERSGRCYLGYDSDEESACSDSQEDVVSGDDVVDDDDGGDCNGLGLAQIHSSTSWDKLMYGHLYM
jgi:hypothetical protein